VRTVCIHCKGIIQPGPPEDYDSSGLCVDCLVQALKPIYRRRQRLEGCNDCFGTSEGFCDQWHCRYRGLCVNRDMSDYQAGREKTSTGSRDQQCG